MNSRWLIFFGLLFHVSLLWSSTSFKTMYSIPAGEFTELADLVVSARFDPSTLKDAKKYKYLEALQKRLELETQKSSDHPLLWFITGLNLNNLAEIRYILLLERKGQQKASQDIKVSNFNIARSRAYDNAIRLDNTEPHLLSSAIYATMGYGLSNRQRIKTYSRELKLGSASENESNEWFLHWGKIDALVHEKKLDKAQAALTELKNLLEDKGKIDSSYSKIAKQAETQVAKVTQQSEVRKVNHAKKAEARITQQEKELWNWKTWISIIIGAFMAGFVLAAAIYYRMRKKQA